MKFKLFPIATLLLLELLTSTVVAQTQEKTPTTKAQKPVVSVKKQANLTYKRVLNGQAKPAKTYQTSLRQLDTVKNTDFTLNGQYQFMLSRSKNINGYKLVNPSRLNAVWASVKDSLKKERAALVTANAKVYELDKTIAALKTEVTGKEETLSNTTQTADEIKVLGISFDKGTYSIIVWSIIGLLIIVLIVVIARSAKNIVEAKHRAQLYEEISAEYQSFKAKSVEKERKLARELQDERNKLDELNNR